MSRKSQKGTRVHEIQPFSGKNEEYITELSEELERKVVKKIDQVLSRAESRSSILDALSKIDKFFSKSQVSVQSRNDPVTYLVKISINLMMIVLRMFFILKRRWRKTDCHMLVSLNPIPFNTTSSISEVFEMRTLISWHFVYSWQVYHRWCSWAYVSFCFPFIRVIIAELNRYLIDLFWKAVSI